MTLPASRYHCPGAGKGGAGFGRHSHSNGASRVCAGLGDRVDPSEERLPPLNSETLPAEGPK